MQFLHVYAAFFLLPSSPERRQWPPQGAVAPDESFRISFAKTVFHLHFFRKVTTIMELRYLMKKEGYV